MYVHMYHSMNERQIAYAKDNDTGNWFWNPHFCSLRLSFWFVSSTHRTTIVNYSHLLVNISISLCLKSCDCQMRFFGCKSKHPPSKRKKQVLITGHPMFDAKSIPKGETPVIYPPWTSVLSVTNDFFFYTAPLFFGRPTPSFFWSNTKCRYDRSVIFYPPVT